MYTSNINHKRCLVVIFLVVILNSALIQNVITDELYYQTYSEHLSTKMIARVLSLKRQYSWVNFVLLPIIFYVKLLFVTCCFWLGAFWAGIKSNFKDYWKVALIAEFISLFFLLINTGLLYYYDFQTLTEIQQFQPFSLLGFLNPENIPAYYHYILATISIPEAIYWIVLAILLKPLLQIDFRKSLGFVAKTYGVGLSLWISFVVFLTLSFTV